MELAEWAKLIRERAGNGSIVKLSYPDACLLATKIEETEQWIEEHLSHYDADQMF